uniref:uncharacterized protein LOC122590597 n=1 Tax=Erigeron canadensis TaxID=72917 RepID=UPI001CB93321|nr:uncharacterized protein LOC122590597 [Erigeron canadensis]
MAVHGRKCLMNFKSKNSGIWASICSSLKEIHALSSVPANVIARRLGNGESTHFWTDIWMGNEAFSSRFPRLYAMETNKQALVSNRWNNGEWSWLWRRNIRDGAEATQLANLTSLIQSIQLIDKANSWTWNVPGNTSFSVHQFRLCLERALFPCEPLKTSWNSLVPKKVNIFVWRLLRDRLPSRLNLNLKGLDIDDISCPLCPYQVESIQHLFSSCMLFNELAQIISNWTRIDIVIANPKSTL